MLDYGIVHQPVASIFTLVPDWFSPMSPHLGIWGSFSARPRSLQHRVLIGPKEFPFIEVHNQEQDRKQEEARQKKIQKAVATLTKRFQAWLTKYAPLEDHAAILDNPTRTAVSEQHPQVESYLEIILAMQEARLGVNDEALEPSPTDPDEIVAAPPPLAQQEQGEPSPGTPPPDWLLPEWIRDEWIPPEVPRGPRVQATHEAHPVPRRATPPVPPVPLRARTIRKRAKNLSCQDCLGTRPSRMSQAPIKQSAAPMLSFSCRRRITT